jgi:hypothetical protein
MNRYYLVILSLIFFTATVSAQDTLPRFSVKNVGNNRFIIGWVNNYDLVKQISIQRSHDSLRNYTTILSVTDPTVRENGYADTKAPNDHMFYRLFIVLDKGQYVFTTPQRPSFDTGRLATRTSGIENIKDSVMATLHPIIPKKPDFIPSFFVYTNRDGYVFINLPDADKKKYHIKFYDEDDSFLFEIKSIREPALTLDKTNFLHAGWFKFELYNDDKLIEKNKIYLAREF